MDAGQRFYCTQAFAFISGVGTGIGHRVGHDMHGEAPVDAAQQRCTDGAEACVCSCSI